MQTKLFSLKAPNYIRGGREIANVLNYLNKIEITVPLKILHSSKLLAKGRGTSALLALQYKETPQQGPSIDSI